MKNRLLKRVIAAAVCGLMVLSLAACAENVKSKYMEAVSLYEAGQYDEAETIFIEISDKKDCSDYIQNCKYIKAISLYEAGQYDEAEKIFTEISDKKDCSDYIQNCKYMKIITSEAWKDIYVETCSISFGKDGKANIEQSTTSAPANGIATYKIDNSQVILTDSYGKVYTLDIEEDNGFVTLISTDKNRVFVPQSIYNQVLDSLREKAGKDLIGKKWVSQTMGYFVFYSDGKGEHFSTDGHSKFHWRVSKNDTILAYIDGYRYHAYYDLHVTRDENDIIDCIYNPTSKKGEVFGKYFPYDM